MPIIQHFHNNVKVLYHINCYFLTEVKDVLILKRLKSTLTNENQFEYETYNVNTVTKNSKAI